jgi:hypothetical protein
MPRTRKGTPPAYPKRPHVSGQARITARLATSKRRDLTLGAFGSPESRAEYRRVLAMPESNGGLYPVKDGTAARRWAVMVRSQRRKEPVRCRWKPGNSRTRTPMTS